MSNEKNEIATAPAGQESTQVDSIMGKIEKAIAANGGDTGRCIRVSVATAPGQQKPRPPLVLEPLEGLQRWYRPSTRMAVRPCRRPGHFSPGTVVRLCPTKGAWNVFVGLLQAPFALVIALLELVKRKDYRETAHHPCASCRCEKHDGL